MIKKTLFMMLAWVALTLPALAEEKAADSMIAAVQGDLNRYEPMVASMSPGSRSGARVSRFVPIMESRLSSSRHQQSASWLETSHRLKTLKQALLDIKMGKKPSFSAASSHTPAQASMSDPDRARKIEALNSEFIRDINRVRGNDIAKPSIAHNFMQKIAAMQALSAGFQDNSLGYVQQVNGFIVESDHFLQKRIAIAETSIKQNNQTQAGVAAENEQIKTAAYAEAARRQQKSQTTGQSERVINKIHRSFTRAFSSVRGSLAYLNGNTLSRPEEARDWTHRIKKLKAIVDQYQDKTLPVATKDIATYTAVKERFDNAAKELAANNKEQYKALLLQQADKATRQAALEKQQHRDNLHRQFTQAYGTLRISLPYLNAETLADPREAEKWSSAVKEMGAVVSQYQDKSDPKVLENIATYNDVKGRVESALAQNAAATGGLTAQDLSRDHQALEDLVVKYKPFFSKLDTRSTASIKQIESFIQSGGKREITQALASFSSKYGNSPSDVAARFKLINGGRAWRTPERQVPESGFERLSSWSAQLLELDSLQESVLAMNEEAGNSKKHYDLSSENYKEKDYLDIAEVNSDFEGYRKTLETLLKEHPNRKKAQKYLAELDNVKRTYIDAMNKKIDNVKWNNGDKYFRGPGDLEELKQAAKDFIRLKDSGILIFSMYSGEWKVNEKDYLGRPINYYISFKYAKKMKDKPDTAMIYAGGFVTEGAKRSLPFVDYSGFNDEPHKPEIRIKNLH